MTSKVSYRAAGLYLELLYMFTDFHHIFIKINDTFIKQNCL